MVMTGRWAKEWGLGRLLVAFRWRGMGGNGRNWRITPFSGDPKLELEAHLYPNEASLMTGKSVVEPKLIETVVIETAPSMNLKSTDGGVVDPVRTSIKRGLITKVGGEIHTGIAMSEACLQ